MSQAGSLLVRAPRTWAAWAVGLLSIALLVVSLWPTKPLAERKGFDAAVAFLRAAAGPEAFVVVWPPEQASTLESLPPELRAADAVPIESPEHRRYARLLVLGPAGFAAPPELRGAKSRERHRFGGVEVDVFAFAGARMIEAPGGGER